MRLKDLFKRKPDISEEASKARRWINEADVIIIGIGGGLSAAAGIDYTKPHVVKEFFSDYYRMGYKHLFELDEMYRQITPENAKAYWGYWGRYIKSIGYDHAIGNGYRDLLRLIRNKNYYIYTTNIDGQVQRAGFEKERIVELEGDCRMLTCSKKCCEKVYESEELLETMIKSMGGNLEVAGNKVPRCPHCDAFLIPAIHTNAVKNVDKSKKENNFVDNLESIKEDFEARLIDLVDPKIVVLELGVGTSAIDLLRTPLEKIVQQYEGAKHIRINKEDIEIVAKMKDNVMDIKTDLEDAIAEIASGVVSM